MLPIASIISVLIVLVFYVFCTFFMDARMRKFYKLLLYTVVFLALFFPDIEFFELPFGSRVRFHTYAIVLCGVELFELLLKFYVEGRKREKKPISKKLERIYESL